MYPHLEKYSQITPDQVKVLQSAQEDGHADEQDASALEQWSELVEENWRIR